MKTKRSASENIQKRREKMKRINTFTADLVAFAVLVVGLVASISLA